MGSLGCHETFRAHTVLYQGEPQPDWVVHEFIPLACGLETSGPYLPVWEMWMLLSWCPCLLVSLHPLLKQLDFSSIWAFKMCSDGRECLKDLIETKWLWNLPVYVCKRGRIGIFKNHRCLNNCFKYYLGFIHKEFINCIRATENDLATIVRIQFIIKKMRKRSITHVLACTVSWTLSTNIFSCLCYLSVLIQQEETSLFSW